MIAETVLLFRLLGWPETVAGAVVEYVAARLADAGSITAAYETLRRDTAVRAQLDIERATWTGLLGVLLGGRPPPDARPARECWHGCCWARASGTCSTTTSSCERYSPATQIARACLRGVRRVSSGGGVELDRAVDSIRVGYRSRHDLGDLDELCASIQKLGCCNRSRSPRTAPWSAAPAGSPP